MNTRLEAPAKYRNDVNVWVDEAIWGHRLYNDQTPWLVFLEFLAIFQSRHADGKALNESRNEGVHESFTYYIPRLIPLRQLVFNNPHIRYVEENHQSDPERWRAWLESFSSDDDLGYLQERFGSFTRLSRVVEFFQSTAIEPHRQRRWTSHFLFPYGPNCLYADLPANVNGSPDRRFFARSGELLYLMLNRSSKGKDIAEMISKKLLRQDETWNRVVRALLPEGYRIDSNPVSSTIGYLPFAKRPEYEDLAETWTRLLNLDLSGEALLDPLMRLSSLHMLLYMLRRANEEVGDTSEPKFVLEIASPRRTTLFELSKENFGANRMLSTRAVRAYIESARKDERWRDALQARAPAEAVREYLTERYEWQPDDGPPSGDPDTIFEALRDYAERRHQQHVVKVHMEWGRQIGLAVSRRGAGTWYSPDDSLLKALVMCVVDEGREEYHRFLAKLYDRFRLVIGANEAELAFGTLPTDQNAFMQNTQRLEQRLRTLGLLRRLSDDCAYVENPFRSNT
ncbi:hypothetical protein [Nitrosomonas halophila]|uniref:Uncharacterized protein n=1 Tax=Nitrosomonas halophila TaxID=44576 RepID=A0A1H3N7K2_9PROT|nr:hypothetical protein [Nitrosomonas halophila]SDY84852.1 hypothetical protein SAMN05421881_10698 [Nitrosomonas halophila]